MADKFTSQNMGSMLQHRMGWNYEDPKCRFREFRCYKLDDEKAVVFILKEKEAFLLYDELPLYPSDTLVTKIRLME